MALCTGTNGCGCAIQSTSLSISGSGTGADPWVVDLLGGTFTGDFYNFASATERTAQLPSPGEGDLVWLRDVNRYEFYNGTAWVPLVGEAISYSPTFTSTGLSPSIGSTGTRTGWYTQLGSLVLYQFIFVFGGTGITDGTGTYHISVPLAPKSISGSSRITRGWIEITDATGPTYRDFMAIIGSDIEMRSANTTAFGAKASITDSTDGISYAAGDQISGQVVYHAA